ncbi:MAG TPA: type II toxin-antitoxin system VapC family toxin [Solirubrobacterales bacterium]
MAKTTMTDTLLLDSGVWVASMSGDDRFESAARELVADLDRRFCALDLTLYEGANAVGSKRGRFDQAASECRAITERRAWATVRVDGDLVEAVIEVSAGYGLTSYDAAYVAVARRYDWTLVSTGIRDPVSRVSRSRRTRPSNLLV